MDDPRFKHVASDPRFKAMPKRYRKVIIDKRFQSMFTSDSFKVKYKVDKRGRKVKETSGEDLRKYYELGAGEEVEDGKIRNADLAKSKGKAKKIVKSATSAEWDSAELATDSSEEEEEEEESSESSGESDVGSCDLFLDASSSAAAESGVMARWTEELSTVPLSEDTSHRLAVCNMDWDHVGAKDIFVLLHSFKPAGACIVRVTVYPSDFGLERLANEEIEGPVGMEGGSCDDQDQSGEGTEYSREKLRQYQLNRFKYYYAVVECDTMETAQHIYTQCNGLEYEHSGGQLDLRFIPDDMSFDDRQADSVATEDTIPAEFTPADFVSSALQQSKVKLSWDETDPRRVKVTQRSFTKDDLQSMNFSAYLASSSDSEEEEGEELGGGGAMEDKKLRYKALLQDEEATGSANEDMEITWEPGLKESMEKIVKKKKTEDGLTPWQQYLEEKKRRRKESKRRKTHPKDPEVAESQGSDGQAVDIGFDDPFFQHGVTMATAATTKHKKAKRKEESESEQKEKAELELLMMSDEEGGESGLGHFSFPSIMRSEKEASKKKKRKGKVATPTTDDFKVDVTDKRFEAVFESHLYAPDPSAPQYKATKGMADIMAERQRRKRKKAWQQDPTTGQPLPDSLNSLVKSVKSKTKLKLMKNKKKN